jgi:hypothetical protein
MGVRVSNDVLVVPPFDCAWLSSPDVEHLTTASAEGGEGSSCPSTPRLTATSP